MTFDIRPGALLFYSILWFFDSSGMWSAFVAAVAVHEAGHLVGGLLSDAYATVVGCAGLLRSTVGCFGLVAVCLLVLPTLVQCICWHLGLHLAAGAAGLFQLSPVEKLCRTAAGSVRVLIAVLAVLALLMVVSTTVIAFSAGR